MAERPVMLNQKKKSSPPVIAGSILLGLVFLLIMLFAGFNFWVNANCMVIEVSGDSMQDTLESGEILYARKNVVLSRGDIVILDVTSYRSEHSFSGDFIVKRVVATEGDIVMCIDGVVSVRYKDSVVFTPVSEPYVKGTTADFHATAVGEGEIYCMGDNRPVSYDSRTVGCFKTNDVVGIVQPWALKIRRFTAVWEGMRSAVTVHQ